MLGLREPAQMSAQMTCQAEVLLTLLCLYLSLSLPELLFSRYLLSELHAVHTEVKP